MTTNTQISPQMPANYIMPPQYVVATPEDEINVLELADQFLDKWRWWVSGTVVGGLLGLGAAFVIPPKYEARGVLRVAQVGVIEADGQGEFAQVPVPLKVFLKPLCACKRWRFAKKLLKE